ncbi:hypothetical protein [Agrobacterium rosae]|uniref:hypothetical protein n=1 Tax=Agrobacterium rosae TaxID=1972867 RepID=UPI002033B1BB|nr:hypothetical protein [Agrobacterium rosae]MCM2433224.1 hypothetical protein [Agrobacterium rosae]
MRESNLIETCTVQTFYYHLGYNSHFVLDASGRTFSSAKQAVHERTIASILVGLNDDIPGERFPDQIAIVKGGESRTVMAIRNL